MRVARGTGSSSGASAACRSAAWVAASLLLRRLSGWAIGLAVLAAPLGAYAQGPEIERGRALYDARCGACHEKSVHRRESRVARDLAQVRAAVVRWDRETGGLWRPDEIDAVTGYLNDRYYHYPCPNTVCSAERAQTRTGMVRTIPR